MYTLCEYLYACVCSYFNSVYVFVCVAAVDHTGHRHRCVPCARVLCVCVSCVLWGWLCVPNNINGVAECCGEQFLCGWNILSKTVTGVQETMRQLCVCVITIMTIINVVVVFSVYIIFCVTRCDSILGIHC